MRVVIFTPIPFWHPGTGELIEKLKTKGIHVIALDIFQGRMFDEQGAQQSLIPSYLNGFPAKVYLRLFRDRIISRLINDQDIVDIHFVEPAYSRHLEALKRKNVKVVATLFGSDLFRTDPAQKAKQMPIFDVANAIVMSKNMVPYFCEHFPGYDGKFHFNQYGSSRLDLIAEKNLNSDRPTLRKKYGIDPDKIVVSCGYNAKREQQHLEILKEIDKLSETEKQRIFLLFSLTYGSDEAGEDYINLIKRKLDEVGLPNVCLTNRLTDDEIAEIRIVSDITLNLQTTDALASSIKEAMAAGDIMVIGKWLPYEIYRDLGIFYTTTSFETLTEDLQKVLADFDQLKIQSLKNQEKVLNFASWRILIEDWVKFYKEI